MRYEPLAIVVRMVDLLRILTAVQSDEQLVVVVQRAEDMLNEPGRFVASEVTKARA